MSADSNAIGGRVFVTEISKLDALLKDGGIIIPENSENGVYVLLKGPAGAGKSTLALLLAAKCARDGGPVLYCALEQSGYSLQRLSRSLNIDEKKWVWVEEDEPVPDPDDARGFIYISGLQTTSRRERAFEDYLELLVQQIDKNINIMDPEKISMIVIDSLNVFGRDSIERVEFEALKKGLAHKNRILLFIGELEEKRSQWDRLVDLVIDLGSKTLLGEYFLRTITIEKARFQNHILGSHVIKIKGKRAFLVAPKEKVEAAPVDVEKDAGIGMFIYPSLHYHLSVAIDRKKRLEAKQELSPRQDGALLETGFEVLDKALNGGIKRGTMTAISSNISYVARGVGLSFLANGVENGERSLYLSLQDDPNNITKLPSKTDLLSMVHQKKLVIKSFRPGFISAEEFVDTIIKEILDSSGLNAQFQRVLFDDVGQISLRFPLLDKAPVFLPTLMDIFKLYDMTALFLRTTISSGDSKSHSHTDDLYDLVNTVIEVQEKELSSTAEAAVRIRKIAEQYYVPQDLKLRIDQTSGGRIYIEEK